METKVSRYIPASCGLMAGVWFPTDRFFCTPPALLPLYYKMGKRPELEANHWSPSSVEVKYTWRLNSTTVYVFIDRYLRGGTNVLAFMEAQKIDLHA